MNKRMILVPSHTRSGTHFVINALCMNFKNVEFPLIRDSYASLEGLFLAHDKKYIKEWEEHIYANDGKTKIFKTHLMPSEILRGLNDRRYLNKAERKIIKIIYENSKIVYIYRDGKDVLVSSYYYQKNAGGGLPQGNKDRLKDCTFSEFLKMPNRCYVPIRSFEEKDENQIKRWCSHINEWLAKENVVNISYESLQEDFEGMVKRLAVSLGMTEELVSDIKKPPFVTVSCPTLFSRALGKLKRISTPLIKNITSEKVKIIPPSYPRKGIVGDWKSHFSDSDLEFFMKFAKETMQRLNYKI